MKKLTRSFLFLFYIFTSIGLFLIINFLLLHFNFFDFLKDWTFLILLPLYLLTIEEFYHWVKNGKRSEMSDIIAILFFFFLIFFFSKDLLTSLMGAFSLYLWIGIFELKDYPVINKILIISLVTYNIIFIAGIISSYLGESFYINTSFAFSFWIILIMGFLLFGRKYIIIWRFMSPEYLTLFLYIIAWLAVVFISQYTSLNFITYKPITSSNFNFIDFFANIYFILIIVNWLVYFISGLILDKMLGIKRVKDEKVLDIVNSVKNNIGIKGKVKIGIGNYPILNAMAYGPIFDKRIAIIAEDIKEISEDELKGIVAHELAHTKGKHTLILTLITSGDLIIRMLLGIPATYYDYTFGDPKIPMIAFIFLNLGIYIILFIFVRILEGKADLKAKKSGYGRELVKALYNLESFYAKGREIGLNIMLLSDEKISKENQLMDYMDTANYLYNSMIKPSRPSLLANFINSHPPSFYRIIAILGNNLKPCKEAVLPFICLKKSKQKKYAKMFEKQRESFKIIANEKFKEYFKIDNISSLMNRLNRKEIYKFDIKKDFLFKNKISDELIIGKLIDIEFYDDISDSDQYIIKDLKTNQIKSLKSSIYTPIQIDLNGTYFIKKDVPLILTDIEFMDNAKKSSFIFLNEEKKKLKEQVFNTKLPNSIKLIENFQDQDVFVKLRGDLKIYRCTEVLNAKNFEDFKIKLAYNQNSETQLKQSLDYTIKELIIRPRKIYLDISKKINFRKSEIEVIKWLIKKQLRTYIFLKKAVNNLEIGYIQKLYINTENFDKNSNRDSFTDNNVIFLKNIFGKDITIPYRIIELISFVCNTGMIQIKSMTSFSTRLGYRILKKFKPERIIIT